MADLFQTWTAITDWFARAHHLVPPEDRKILLSPPRLVARFARFALARHHGNAGQAHADDVRARDPELIELCFDFLRAVGRYYFRFRAEHVDRVPPSGPVLFVGNHSGGLVPLDGFFTALAVHDHFGVGRAVYALVHDFMFEDPTLRRYCGRLGMLRAGHESARHAFGVGGSVIVFPGSDLDTFRPFRDRDKVVLGGRKGFLKLAMHEHVPIVPVVTTGAEQFIVLTRGDRLARLVHAHQWARTEVLPLILAIPWGLTLGFVPYVPLPAQMTVAFLPPMSWPERDPENPEDLERCYEEVEAVMQAELARITRGRRFLLGQPRSPAPTPRRETPAAHH